MCDHGFIGPCVECDGYGQRPTEGLDGCDRCGCLYVDESHDCLPWLRDEAVSK